MDTMGDQRLILKSSFRVLEEYRSRSKISFWEDLRVGDVVDVVSEIQSTGDSPARPIILQNKRTKETIETTFNILSIYLGKLGFENIT
jgi:hypothetical protein